MIPRFACGMIALLLTAPLVRANDWPQWGGPDRNAVSRETGLLAAWPKDGPKLLWTVKDAGLGFSAPVVVGKTVYLCGSDDKDEIIIALDTDNKGKRLWTAKIGPIFTFQGNNWGDGPRGSPAVDGNLLYALGGQGDLVCVDVTLNGKEIWRKNMIKDFGGEMMSTWGYSESPLVDGGHLICTPGTNGLLAALDKKSGKLEWRSKEDYKATFASVVAANINGVRQYIVEGYVSNSKGAVVCGIDAKTGNKLWEMPFFKGQSDFVAPTPIVKDNLVYVTCADGAGKICHLFEIGNDMKPVDKYPKNVQKTMQNKHGGVVLVKDHVYGHSDGRDRWVCQEFLTGKLAWDATMELECSSGSIVSAEGLLYLYSDQGEAVLLQANPLKWTELGRFKIPERSAYRKTRRTSQSSGVWTHPVIANGRLYLRDGEFVFCYDISAGNKAPANQPPAKK